MWLNFSFCVRLLQIPLFLFILAPFVKAGQSEAEMIELAGRSGYYVRDIKETPAFAEILQKVFDRLAQAQENLAEGAAVSLNKLLIANSNEVNAFVVSSKDVGIRMSYNVVFLTTRLIEKMIDLRPRYIMGRGLVPLTKEEVRKEIEEGIIRLAGVVAHELGHPMDYINEYRGEVYIENHYGQQADQAIELKADIEAVRILRKAGMPDDALYRSLQRLFEGTRSQSVLLEALGTHPQSDFRLTSSRLYLTLMRFDQGFQKDISPISISDETLDKLQKEYSLLTKESGPFVFKLPTSLTNAVDRLQALIDSPEWTDWQHIFSKTGSIGSLELNRLIVSIDWYLAKAEKEGRKLTEDENQQFRRFLDIMLETEATDTIYNPEEYIEKIKSRVKKGDFFEDIKSHSDYLDQLEIYQSPETIKYVEEKNMRGYEVSEEGLLVLPGKTNESDSKSNNDIDFKTLFLKLEAAFSVMNSKKYLERYGDLIVRNLIDGSKSDDNQYPLNEFHRKLLARLPSKARLQALGLLIPKVTSEIESSPSQWYFTRLAFESIPLPLIDSNSQYAAKRGNLFEKDFDRLALLARSGKYPEAQATMADLQRVFSRLWQVRGYYGTLEIFMRRNIINWHLVAKVLEMDVRVTLNQVEAAVKSYTAGKVNYEPFNVPRYVDLLDQLNGQKILRGQGGERIEWLKSPLSSYLLGDKNPEIGTNTKRHETAVMIVGPHYFSKNPTERNQRFLRQLIAVLEGHKKEINKDNAVEWFATSFIAAHRDMNIMDSVTPESYESVILDNFDRLPVSSEVKFVWLRLWFFKDIAIPKDREKLYPNLRFDWLLHSRVLAKNGYEILKKYGLVQSPFDLLRTLRKLSSFKFHQVTGDDMASGDYFSILNNLSLMLKEELANLPRESLTVPYLLEFTSFLSTSYGRADRDFSTSPNIQDLRDLLVERAGEVPMTKKELYQFFYQLTQSGGTAKTDQFFSEKILPIFSPETRVRHVEQLLKTERLSGQNLKLAMTKDILEPRVIALEKLVKAPRKDIYNLIMDLQKYAPEGSIAKDDYIESLGWRLKLKGSELDGFIEDQKSQNWRKSNPILVRAASLISTEISRMSVVKREEFLHYLINPKKFSLGIPDGVVKEFEKILLKDLAKDIKGRDGQWDQALRQKAADMARQLKYKVEAMLRDSAPTERIPLMEVVLTAGPQALLRQKIWPHNLTRTFLGYEPESLDEKMLEAYLEIIPIHEQGVSMAYLLSQSGQEKASVADIFELFGTVGVKFGQLASIWEIFGPEVAKETRRLKDHARALSKYEFLNYLKVNERAIFDQIKDVEILLGSASVKTVALVELTSGKRLVMAVRGEHIGNKIQSNLRLGKAFLSQLRKFNLEKKSSLLALLIDALEEQLMEEIQFPKEAERIAQTKILLEKLNNSVKKDFSGWSIDIPTIDPQIPVKEGVFAMALGSGTSFDSLSLSDKKIAGQIMTRVSLAMLFDYGWFDPDRHKGNWLIDSKNKKIWFLDVGQLENFNRETRSWKWDDRLTLAQFIRAVDEKDIMAVIRYGVKMAKPGVQMQIDETNLRKALQDIFTSGKQGQASDSKAQADLWIGVVTALTEHGVPLSKQYLFGALKGIMVLSGENYVTSTEFRDILRSEIKDLLREKIPAVLINAINPERSKQANLGLISCRRALSK